MSTINQPVPSQHPDRLGPPPDLGGQTAATNSGAWKSDLDSYPDLRVLVFKSDQVTDQAIDLLWTPELRELPHDLAGGTSLVVPAEAVKYFRAAGLQFEEKKLLAPADLPADELNALRSQQGIY